LKSWVRHCSCHSPSSFKALTSTMVSQPLASIHHCTSDQAVGIATFDASTTLTRLHPFNGLFSNTTWVSRYSKPFWILLEQQMMGWQWHQLDRMQIICTSLQTDNHASTSPPSFYRQTPFLPLNQQCQSTEGSTLTKISLVIKYKTRIPTTSSIMNSLCQFNNFCRYSSIIMKYLMSRRQQNTVTQTSSRWNNKHLVSIRLQVISYNVTNNSLNTTN